MNFQRINPAHVVSDSGFSLQAGPMHLCWVYAEGQRKIHVNSEAVHLGRDGWGLRVYLSTLPEAWLPPDNVYAISARKREEIAENIKAALQFLDVNRA